MCKMVAERSERSRHRIYCGLITWFFVALHCLQWVSASDIQTMFNGSQYIAYPIPSHEGGSTSDRILLSFKTTEPYGVLFYSGGTQGDFVALEIIRGKLSYSADLGSIAGTSGFHQVTIGDNVADNKWHHVVIIQNEKKVTLMLDDESKSIVAPGLFVRLDLDVVFYVGGINKAEQKKHKVWIPETKHYKGCLSNVKFRSRDILHSAKFKLLDTEMHGEVAFQCLPEVYNPMGFINSNSKILLHREKTVQDTDLSITLRTFEASGIIATMSTTNGHVTLTAIDSIAYLSVSFDHLIRREEKVTISLGKLDDGDWHKVRISISAKTNSVKLMVDSETKTYHFQPHFELSRELGSFTKVIRLGGPSIKHPGFIGCIRYINLDGRNITWESLQQSQITGISRSCIPKDFCFPNPCLNSGNCSQDQGRFTCTCPRSLFKGDRCEQSIYKRTCDEIYKAGKKSSGIYTISPNGVNSFDVYCQMDHKLGPATLVRHTLPANSRVADKRPRGSQYIYEIEYTIGKESAAEVADASTTCRQFIRYDCFQSKLLDSLKRYSSEHTRGGRWASRNGTLQTYWGGAKPGTKVCGCGMKDKRNCADHHLDCNCDIGDMQWRNDKGFLTDKDALPVTMVQFSIDQQKGTTQRSTFTLGQLECFGTSPLPTTTPMPTTQTTTATASPTEHPSTVLNMTSTAPPAKVSKAPVKDVKLNQPNQSKAPITISTVITNSTLNSTYDASTLSNQDDLFPKPYLVTIVVIGTILCFLLIALVGILFKAKVSGLLFRKSCPPKPHVEIEEYDPRSSVISSDWEFRVGTSFPTSTPDESTTTSEEDMRIRTLEDVRGRRKYGRLGTWGSRTASAPTLGGRMRNSRISITERRCASRHSGIINSERSNMNDDASSQPYETSSESSKYTIKSTTNTSNSNSSRFSTCTEQGTASDSESVKDYSAKNRDDSSAAKRSSKGERDFESMRGENSAQVPNGNVFDLKNVSLASQSNRPEESRLNGNGFVGDNYMKVNGLSVPYSNQDVGKQYYPQVNQNNYTLRPHIRRIPPPVPHPEYGTHLQLMNTMSRCYFPSQIGRFMPIGKRPFTSDGIPFVQQTIQEVDVAEEEQDVETSLMDERIPSRKNSSTIIANGAYRHDMGNDYAEDNHEGLALLRRQIIEKATNLDDCSTS